MPSWTERFDDVVEVTRAHELEGVVYKRLDAPYRPWRRSHAWRKLKHRRQETLAVSAWTPGDRRPDEGMQPLPEIFNLDRALEHARTGGATS